MTRFRDISVALPPMWQHTEETIRLAKQDPLAGPILTVQAQLFRELGMVQDLPSTAALFGWLQLWTRTFAATEILLGALGRGSGLGIDFLSRVFQDIALHLELICHPFLNPDSEIVTLDSASIRSAASLVGFTAWCLAWDIFRLDKANDPTILASVFDPSSGQELFDARRKMGLPVERAAEDIELVSDQEADLDVKRAERFLVNKTSALSELFDDPVLEPWSSKLRDRKNSPGELFHLLGVSAGRTHDAYRKLGIDYSYELGYRAGSVALHGSSFASFFHQTDQVITPKVADAANELRRKLPMCTENGQIAVDLLKFLRHRTSFHWNGAPAEQ